MLSLLYLSKYINCATLPENNTIAASDTVTKQNLMLIPKNSRDVLTVRQLFHAILKVCYSTDSETANIELNKATDNIELYNLINLSCANLTNDKRQDLFRAIQELGSIFEVSFRDRIRNIQKHLNNVFPDYSVYVFDDIKITTFMHLQEVLLKSDFKQSIQTYSNKLLSFYRWNLKYQYISANYQIMRNKPSPKDLQMLSIISKEAIAAAIDTVYGLELFLIDLNDYRMEQQSKELLNNALMTSYTDLCNFLKNKSNIFYIHRTNDINMLQIKHNRNPIFFALCNLLLIIELSSTNSSENESHVDFLDQIVNELRSKNLAQAMIEIENHKKDLLNFYCRMCSNNFTDVYDLNLYFNSFCDCIMDLNKNVYIKTIVYLHRNEIFGLFDKDKSLKANLAEVTVSENTELLIREAINFTDQETDNDCQTINKNQRRKKKKIRWNDRR